VKQTTPFRYVADAAELDAAFARLHQVPVVALDTEFERSRTYFARPALIQIYDGETVFLLDPLGLPDMGPLGKFLADQRVRKILHACREDLELLYQLTGELPRPLCDTQILAAFAGFGIGVGYRNLVETLCDVQLPKDQTRSNWLKRPLSPPQLQYAANDVRHLLTVEKELRSRIGDSERLQWADADSTRLVNGFNDAPVTGTILEKLPGAWQLERKGLAVSAAAWAWREDEAQRRDRPRRHILDDAALVAIGQRRPETFDDLAGMSELPDSLHGPRAAGLLAAIADALSQPEEKWPQSVPGPNDLGSLTGTIRRLKRTVRATAEALELPPELLAGNRVVSKLVRRDVFDGRRDLPPELDGWRAEVIGRRLLDALDQEATPPN